MEPQNQSTQNSSSLPATPNIEKPLASHAPEVNKPKSKFPSLLFIIGIVLFLLVTGLSAGFYIFNQQSSKTAPKITLSPSPAEVQKQKSIQTPNITPTATPIDPNQILDTSYWKTYTGNGFEFKYPSSYKIKEKGVSIDVNGSMVINDSVSDLKEQMCTAGHDEDKACFVEFTSNPNSEQQVVKHLDNRLALDLTMSYPRTDGGKRIIQTVDDPKFQITIPYGPGYDPTIATIIQKILSSFKFTN